MEGTHTHGPVGTIIKPDEPCSRPQEELFINMRA